MARITTEEFIRRAREVHGDRYDYNQVVYKHSEVKVDVVCSVHGVFKVTPCNHISHKRGCRSCSIDRRRSTKEKFIEKANRIHNYRYDYSRIDYKDSSTKVLIICKVHGEFLQIPSNHLTGYGCMECRRESSRVGLEEFIRRSRSVHANKFDYSEVNYKNTTSKVIIICPHHGKFEQSPHGHLLGDGCSECSKKKQYTTETAARKVEQVHGGNIKFIDEFNVKTTNKYKFLCKCGNIWNSMLDSIIRGSGCPACAKTGFNKYSEKSYFYILEIDGKSKFTKFGISSNLKDRFRDHRFNLRKAECFYNNSIIIETTGQTAFNLEQHILHNYECGVSNIKGFRKESTYILSSELLNICKNWLTENSKSYTIIPSYNKQEQ